MLATRYGDAGIPHRCFTQLYGNCFIFRIVSAASSSGNKGRSGARQPFRLTAGQHQPAGEKPPATSALGESIPLRLIRHAPAIDPAQIRDQVLIASTVIMWHRSFRSRSLCGVSMRRGNIGSPAGVGVIDVKRMGPMSVTPNTTGQQLLKKLHARRNAAVTSAQGNLALVNTQWVDSEQTIYGVPGIWAPRDAGQSGLRLTSTASDNIVVDGHLVDGSAIVRGQDDDNPSSIVFSDTVTGFVIASEQGSYALRVWDAQSEGILEFGRIDAFEHNPEWVVTALFTEVPGGQTVGFEHLKDNGATRELVVPGEITFEKDGIHYSLAAFKSGNALQLVFADSTNGDSSYSVGRFLFVAPNADGTITLDFNRAILPPCAFSYNFNCPLPPLQNRFTVPIEAGEKNALKKDGSLLH